MNSNIAEASKISSSTKLRRIHSIAASLTSKTKEAQSKRDGYLMSKSIDAKLKQKKLESLQVLAQSRHQKELFMKTYGTLLRKITTLFVMYRFMENVRDYLHFGKFD